MPKIRYKFKCIECGNVVNSADLVMHRCPICKVGIMLQVDGRKRPKYGK